MPRCFLTKLVPVALLACSFAGTARADAIRLRDQALVRGANVTLGDVAQLEGERAAALGALIVGAFGDSDTQVFVTLTGLRDTLGQEKVNLGAIALDGFTRCKVTRVVESPAPAVESSLRSAEPAPLLANTIDEAALTSPVTLRDKLLEALQDMAGVPAGELQVTFSDLDLKELSQPAGQDRYAFEVQTPVNAAAPSILGKQPIVIRRFKGDEEAASYRVRPYITRRTLAVVTSAPMLRGEAFTRGNTEVREIVLDRDRGTVTVQLSQVLGQQSRTSLGAGAVVYTHDLQPPRLVERNDMVEVRCLAGSIMLRMAGRAEEVGCLNDVIRVTNVRAMVGAGSSQQRREQAVFLARVTGLRQVTVEVGGEDSVIEEGASDAQASVR